MNGVILARNESRHVIESENVFISPRDNNNDIVYRYVVVGGAGKLTYYCSHSITDFYPIIIDKNSIHENIVYSSYSREIVANKRSLHNSTLENFLDML